MRDPGINPGNVLRRAVLPGDLFAREGATLNTEESFQSVINQTREELARHYLRNSKMSGAKISFLLGFADPNSFFPLSMLDRGNARTHENLIPRTRHRVTFECEPGIRFAGMPVHAAIIALSIRTAALLPVAYCGSRNTIVGRPSIPA